MKPEMHYTGRVALEVFLYLAVVSEAERLVHMNDVATDNWVELQESFRCKTCMKSVTKLFK